MSDVKRPDHIERALLQKGIYAGKTEGNSMEPMLVQGRDTVIIKKPEFPLKKYDVPVYHRDDHYTLHRVLKVTKNGYVISGDNRKDLEYDITDADVAGVLAAFYHKGKYVEYGDREYMRYARRAGRRYIWKRIRSLAARAKRKFKTVWQGKILQIK